MKFNNRYVIQFTIQKSLKDRGRGEKEQKGRLVPNFDRNSDPQFALRYK